MASRFPPGNPGEGGRLASRSRPDSARAGTRSTGDLPHAVGSLFRWAREAQRLSQDQVAELTEGRRGQVSRTMVSAIECGQCLPGLETFVALSCALHVNPMEVLERVDLAAKLPLDITELPPEELRSRAEDYFWAGDYRSALAAYDAMRDQLLLDPPQQHAELSRRHARIEINRAAALRRCCALSAARTAAERAIALADGIPELQAEAYVVLATVLVQSGLLPFAQDAAEHAVRLSIGQPAHGLAWIVKGETFFALRRFEDARAAFSLARKLVRQARDRKHAINVEGNLGASLLGLGRRALARQRFARAVRLAKEHDVPAAEAFWLVELGRVLLEEGKLEEAEAHARAALRIAKPADQALTIFRAEWLRHLVSRARGSAGDRHRLAYLRKLYVRVREHRGLSVIREYEAAMIEPRAERKEGAG